MKDTALSQIFGHSECYFTKWLHFNLLLMLSHCISSLKRLLQASTLHYHQTFLTKQLVLFKQCYRRTQLWDQLFIKYYNYLRLNLEFGNSLKEKLLRMNLLIRFFTIKMCSTNLEKSNKCLKRRKQRNRNKLKYRRLSVRWLNYKFKSNLKITNLHKNIWNNTVTQNFSTLSIKNIWQICRKRMRVMAKNTNTLFHKSVRKKIVRRILDYTVNRVSKMEDQ